MSEEQQQHLQQQLHQHQQQHQIHNKALKDNMTVTNNGNGNGNGHGNGNGNGSGSGNGNGNPNGNGHGNGPGNGNGTAHGTGNINQVNQRKSNIHEMRNQEFVSRLMAATPPYLYSATVGPNNFFFSDMLRSLVQARNNENARNLQLQQSMLARRPRKRTWSQHRPYYEQYRDRKENEEKHQVNATPLGASTANIEKPLELTNKTFLQLASKYRKSEEATKEIENKSFKESSDIQSPIVPASNNEVATGGAIDNITQDTPPAASLPPQDLVLPPPPPVWYPSLYPPYGIDPLHFFIDLRVSGHLYDRKKENSSPLNAADSSNPPTKDNETNPNCIGLSNKSRHGSAFSVPAPRHNDLKTNALNAAINLSSAAKFENYAKYYDFGETKENHPFSKTTSANYMLQHLPRLYSHFAAQAAAPDNNNLENCENDTKSDCDADSDGRVSADESENNPTNRDREIDVEIIDSIKYRTDGESSRCSSIADDASITQID